MIIDYYLKGFIEILIDGSGSSKRKNVAVLHDCEEELSQTIIFTPRTSMVVNEGREYGRGKNSGEFLRYISLKLQSRSEIVT